MSSKRIWTVLRKDLGQGPRSPVFLWTIVIPVVATALVQLVFGGLFAPEPRLAIVDLGSSVITAAYEGMDGIEVTLLGSEDEMRVAVEEHRHDAGLVLAAGFDDEVRAGLSPTLGFYVSGESLASDRTLLAFTTLDLVRGLAGAAPPVTVETAVVGEGSDLPISARLVPLVVIFALLIAGVFLTGTSLVEEKERGTLPAILVTPARLSEVLAAKAVLGGVLAVLMSVVTLALNRALGSAPLALLVALLVAGAMCVEIGLLYGAAARDMRSLYALFKGLNIFLFAPVIFYLFPDWPQWVVMVFPTYWVIDPIFEIAVNGAGLADVWLEVVVALAICAVLAVAVRAAVRRMETRLAVG